MSPCCVCGASVGQSEWVSSTGLDRWIPITGINVCDASGGWTLCASLLRQAEEEYFASGRSVSNGKRSVLIVRIVERAEELWDEHWEREASDEMSRAARAKLPTAWDHLDRIEIGGES